MISTAPSITVVHFDRAVASFGRNQPSETLHLGHFSGLQAVNFLVASFFMAFTISLSTALFATFMSIHLLLNL